VKPDFFHAVTWNTNNLVHHIPVVVVVSEVVVVVDVVVVVAVDVVIVVVDVVVVDVVVVVARQKQLWNN
jgi:hypothetical protein